MTKCALHNCDAPDVGCFLGHFDLSKCSSWRPGAEESAKEQLASEDVAVAWSGSALGTIDVGFVSGRAKPTVVGIVGNHNAGKTTLLGSWYLLSTRGRIPSSPRAFAGSFSLAGWEAVAGNLRWSPGAIPPSFPPHTTSRSGRVPGLLHMALRSPNNRGNDYLFTDAPGEWFQKWAINKDSEQGSGAAWVAEIADVFLLIADRDALSGSEMGLARSSIQSLTQRLSAERGNRPVALVWTKADISIGEEIERSVRNFVKTKIRDAPEFLITTKSGGSCDDLIALFQWVLTATSKCAPLPEPHRSGIDPLFLFGRR